MSGLSNSGVIGVLDLQGGVQEHLDHLQRLGVASRPVKRAEELAALAGLIIPGGESTCLSRLLTIFGLREAIEERWRQGLQLWGTCAGAILLARENAGETPFFGLIDITVSRNAFGSQMDSFNCEALAPAVAREPIPLTFIRAPKILRAGPGVRVLLELDGYIAAAEDDRALVTIFHPELTPSLAFHRYFARKCGLRVAEADDAALDPAWTPQSWTRFSYHS
ncbi:MAG TPA: pyridoxal 5'-phosphate synthase glutaminase subunit PdxT [Candidatus Competibacteraceae bacterium]|nr:MAG: pyridoxal 5'-phosphate synthase glutaminase subunit PdxT [Candidatus Competibacteraceae bacterium]HOB63467.1 pyridoxal 5'-phosphate synthase glutaminase subunit PdxT [Candidatus Competibacteraceae bacterium]HQA26265.1 pyridoxal 5'-phosphate synthase glutaminase subunit PdxT [Candidatus Competibacteraceae bacterium]HQD56806.1 pyridoxal 5'-phosphate synthase glutaminase subunit PdxT [Candidatus Competibacteraceae bacterium]